MPLKAFSHPSLSSSCVDWLEVGCLIGQELIARTSSQRRVLHCLADVGVDVFDHVVLNGLQLIAGQHT